MTTLRDKTGRRYAFGFCGACGSPLGGHARGWCDADCQRDYEQGTRPVGITGVRYDHRPMEQDEHGTARHKARRGR